MAKARIEYVGGLSHSARGMTFAKGEAKIITNPDDILYFSGAGGFLVVSLPEAPAKAQALAAPPPLPEDDEEGDDDAADLAASIDDAPAPPPEAKPALKAKKAPPPSTPKKPK